jgi:LmbE family N-acetylglucosaminyl deacetylase
MLQARSVAVVVAHPDDEVIGIGGHLALLPSVRLVLVTDGAPRDLVDARRNAFNTREVYAEARRRELECAMALANVPPNRLECFGFVDQEASLHLTTIARRLAGWLADHQIELVLTHSYEGGHPDHDATAFAVHAASRLLLSQRGGDIRIFEMTSYHAGLDGELIIGAFLPSSFSTGSDDEIYLPLSDDQRALKRRMLSCHASQTEVLAAFSVEAERLRPAPYYNFTKPPHPGPLWYEQFNWGMRGERWRALAAQAIDQLGLSTCR